MNISKIHTTNASLKWFVLIITIISIALLSYPAHAETGTITVTTQNATPVFSRAPTLPTPQANFSRIYVDNATYNQIEQIFINTSDTGANTAYATNGRSTTFTIASCGVGGGTVSYSKASTAIAFYFTNPSTITCTPLTLVFAENIMSDISEAGNNGVALGADFNHPVVISSGTSTTNWVWGAGGSAWRYTAVLDANVNNLYNITYQQGSTQLFTTNITKVGVTTVSTKVLIENASGSPVDYPVQGDNAFNLLNFNATNSYGLGIALNMSISAGGYERVVINTSGTGAAPSPNASNPNAANCPVNCINTSKPTYNNTESANVYGSFYPATTTVTDCLFFGFICTDKTISAESTTGYVFISTQGSTSPIKFLSFTPDMNNNFNLFTNLDIGTYQAQLWGFAAPGSTCTNGIVYDFPFVPLGCYYPHNITSFSVVNASGNLSIVWQTKISNSTAIYGDTITVAWNNVTANDFVVVYDNNGAISQSYNINQSTVSQIPVFIPLYTIGQWRATIYNSSNNNHNVSAYLNVVPPGSVDVNNSYGITMYWSKGADVVGNPTNLAWNTGTYTGNYNISVLSNGVEVRRNAYYGVPGQSQNASYVFNSVGAYVAQFLDVNNTVQAQADILISTSTSGGTNPPTSTTTTTDNMLNSGFFEAIIIFCAFLTIGYVIGGFMGAVLGFSAGFIIDAVYGLLPVWSLFLFAIIAITAFAVMAGKSLVGGGED